MSTFTIEVQDAELKAQLNALAQRSANMQAVLQTVGTKILERTRRRFETSTGPDGTRWKANSAATLSMLAARIGSAKSKRKKDGSLNARGQREFANKKPLIDSGTLMQQIIAHVNGNSLTVSSSMAYSAIHQFGGRAGRGHKVTIPARPYLPIHQDGTLYPQEQAEILQELNAYLMAGL